MNVLLCNLTMMRRTVSIRRERRERGREREREREREIADMAMEKGKVMLKDDFGSDGECNHGFSVCLWPSLWPDYLLV